MLPRENMITNTYSRSSTPRPLHPWRETALFCFCLLFSFLPPSAQAQAQESGFMESRWVVILSAYPGFAEAKADAEKIAKAGAIPFSMEGRVFDKKRGLIYPDNFEVQVFAGVYVARREHETMLTNSDKLTEYLSIERSDGYEGFRKGYYIVVAGIYSLEADANRQTARFKKSAPTAYAKKTRIYMGCMN